MTANYSLEQSVTGPSERCTRLVIPRRVRGDPACMSSYERYRQSARRRDTRLLEVQLVP